MSGIRLNIIDGIKSNIHEVLSRADLLGYQNVGAPFYTILESLPDSDAAKSITELKIAILRLLDLQSAIHSVFSTCPELAELADSLDIPPYEPRQVH